MARKLYEPIINILHKAVLESSQTVIIVIALVKEDERGGHGHASISLLHQSAM
jgi:hypothetical protein